MTELVTDIEEVATGEERRPLPASIELEQQVLGACILSRTAVSKCAAIIDRQVFFRGRHREIYDAILRLFQEGKPADLSLVAGELEKRGVLGESGGPAYLADIASSVGTSANVEHHAVALIEKAIRRRTIALSSRLTTDCFDATGDIYESLGQFEHELHGLSERRWEHGFRPVSAFVDEAYDELMSDEPLGIATGYTRFDALTGGFRRGEFNLVAARPRHGKTAWCLNVAWHVASVAKIPVGFVSLEMKGARLADRLISAVGKIDGQHILRRTLPKDERERYMAAREKIKSVPLYIDQGPKQTTMQIRAKARRLVDESGVRMLFIDYVGRIRVLSRAVDGRHADIAEISGDLAAMAKELNIALVVCVQTNRAVEQRQSDKKPDLRPRLSDLAESGALERDADVVAFLHRPELFGVTQDKVTGRSLKGVARLYLEKARNGPEGIVDFMYIGAHSTFHELARDVTEPPPETDDDDSPY